ncbi:unnamed protein product [Sphenostylis stenocarpa]|uniref:Uncharacterized protein n=1 Tax=Sphenostylis stenocarpa TaxID=92480 RepID=A0AA86SAT9_9FABA|nr:unnamed protein product [Sphenostylis stenocarpa]
MVDVEGVELDGSSPNCVPVTLFPSKGTESANVNPSTRFLVVMGIFGIETLSLGSFGRWIAAFTLIGVMQEKEEENRVEV